MSLETEANKIELTPTAGTTVLDVFPIPYFDNTDIVVTIEDASGDVSTLEYITDYGVVATNGDTSNGCTVTLQVATVAGDTVVISRQVPYTQQYDLQNGSTIVPAALNTALDRTVAQSQQLLDEGNRHITHPTTDPSGTTYNAPSVSARAGKATGWDSEGNVTALNLVDSGTVSGNESAGITVTNNQISAKVDDSTTAFVSGNIVVKDGGVTATQLATDSVTNAKIGTGAVDTDELATDAVTLEKIDADASLTARGIIEQATDTEAITGSDSDRAISASNVTAIFGNSGRTLQATEGFQVLPGGLMMKWGEGVGGAIVFENTVPFSAVYNVTASQVQPTVVNTAAVQCYEVTTTGMNVTVTELGARFNYFVIGKS